MTNKTHTNSPPNDTSPRLTLGLLAFILIVIPLVFNLDTHDQFELPKLLVLRILTGLALASLLIHYVRQNHFYWRWTLLDLPIALWAGWHLFKTVYSYSPSVSWRGEYENFDGTLTQLIFCLLYYLTTQSVLTRQHVQFLLSSFLATATIVAVYALMQAQGLDFIAWASSSVIQDRFFSSLGNPNFLGALMAMALPVCAVFFANKNLLHRRRDVVALWLVILLGTLLWTVILPRNVNHGILPNLHLFFQARDLSAYTYSLFGLGTLLAVPLLLIKRKILLARRLLLLACAVGITLALFNTGTRGAFLGAMASMSTLFILTLLWLFKAPVEKRPPFFKIHSPSRFITLIAASLLAAVTIAALGIPQATFKRFQWSLTHPSKALDQSRWQIWGPTLEMIKDHPISGMGVDTFKTMFPRYSGSKFAAYDGENVSSRMAHSEPLHIAATLGFTGLALWIWIIWAWIRAGIDRWRHLMRSDQVGSIALLAALASLGVGYLVQNLVSFGVASIETPFWISLALLFAFGGTKTRLSIHLKGWRHYAVILLALVCASTAIFSAAKVFSADKDYNFGHMVTGQIRRMSTLPASEAYSLADYAERQLKPFSKQMDTQSKRAYLNQQTILVSLQQALAQNPDSPKNLRPNLISTARELLLLLSAQRQQRGVKACPNEVKYHVFLGLAYEELLKSASDPEAQKHWFELARQSYIRGIQLNPENAYYHGNLGRLYGLMAQRADDPFIKQAEKYYRDAISRAGVTPLFYENLNMIFLRAGDISHVLALCADAEKADPAIGGKVYFSAGAALFQRYRDLGSRSKIAPGSEKKGSLLETYKLASWKAMQAAARLNPNKPDVFHNRAVFQAVQGNRQEVIQELKKVFKIKPGYKRSVDLAHDLGLSL